MPASRRAASIPPPVPRPVLAAVVAALGLAAACGSGATGATGAVPTDPPGRLAFFDDTASTGTVGVTTSTASDGDEAADTLVAPGGETPATDGPVPADGPGEAPTPTPAPVSQPSTTRVVGPVTTVAGPAPVDPSGIYRGVVGLLGADDPVAAPVAAVPVAMPGTQPLTGWPGEVPVRPAAVVKIDNSGPARPQTGIERADLVFEEEVEGGVTRLAAVFHSLGGVVGPVRSGRTTDIPVVVGLHNPLLLYSGANEVTDALLRRHDTVQNRAANRSSGYWRNTSRKAPWNLYTDLDAHWASASGGPPPAQFAYRAPGQPFGGTPTASFTVAYRANTVGWTWNGELWARSQGNKPHTVAAGGQLAVANVVVVHTRRVDTGMVDSSGAVVPEFVFVGSGPATVYSDGQRLDGTWTRPTLSSAATLTDVAGAVIALTPGRTWVQIVGS